MGIIEILLLVFVWIPSIVLCLGIVYLWWDVILSIFVIGLCSMSLWEIFTRPDTTWVHMAVTATIFGICWAFCRVLSKWEKQKFMERYPHYKGKL